MTSRVDVYAHPAFSNNGKQMVVEVVRIDRATGKETILQTLKNGENSVDTHQHHSFWENADILVREVEPRE
jgi:hypothetical protein